MKRFEFSLKKLLRYKQQVLKKEKNDLSNLRKHLQILLDEKKAICERKKHKNIEFVAKMNHGLSPQHIVLHKNYIESLNEKIRIHDNKIEKVEDNIQKQLDLIVEITKEIDSLEKLESKQLEEYKKAEQKANELFIEEFVSHKSFHEVK